MLQQEGSVLGQVQRGAAGVSSGMESPSCGKRLKEPGSFSLVGWLSVVVIARPEGMGGRNSKNGEEPWKLKDLVAEGQWGLDQQQWEMRRRLLAPRNGRFWNSLPMGAVEAGVGGSKKPNLFGEGA